LSMQPLVELERLADQLEADVVRGLEKEE